MSKKWSKSTKKERKKIIVKFKLDELCRSPELERNALNNSVASEDSDNVTEYVGSASESGDNEEKEHGSETVTDDSVGDDGENDAGEKETEEREEIEPTPGPSNFKRSRPGEYIEEEDSEPKPKGRVH